MSSMIQREVEKDFEKAIDEIKDLGHKWEDGEISNVLDNGVK